MKKYLCIILCIISFQALAQTELRVFTLQHRFAQDLYAAISPLVDESGTVTGMNNQLIVRATPAQLAEIEAVIAQLDVARVNRRITVQSQQNQQSTMDNTQISGNVRRGRVIIGNNPNAAPNSGRIDVTRNEQHTTQNSQQFLQVVDGERAYIRVGTLVPFTQEWITLTRRYAQVTRSTDWVEVSTGFAVRPRTIGNQVELEITPRISNGYGQQSIDFETLSTIVHVSLGEWVDIGQTMQQRDDVSRKILGSQTGTSYQKSGLSIKVD
ncbi:type II secretory pathway, component PulD [Methylophilaceae bacterium 11]|nr:type II secretory pathway, component PulD [Methylophilaceae bacterium 11]